MYYANPKTMRKSRESTARVFCALLSVIIYHIPCLINYGVDKSYSSLVNIDEMRGASEDRTEQYSLYCEGEPEQATTQIAIFTKLYEIPAAIS